MSERSVPEVPSVVALLKSYGIRQADLAQRLGVRKSTVSMWFRGKSKIPAYCRDDLWALATLAREAIEAGGEGRGALATWTLSHDRQCPLPQSVGDVERHYLTRGIEILQRHAPPDCTTLVLNATTLEDLRQGVGMVLQGISAIQVRWAQMPLPLSERESKVVTSCGGK